MKKWGLRVVIGLLPVLAALYAGLFMVPPSPTGDWNLDLAELRRLAQSIPGDKPTQIRVERTFQFGFPGSIIRAGDGWGLVPMQVLSYQLVFPRHTAIIDSAMTAEQAHALPGSQTDTAALDRLAKGMRAADLILVTHEHVDHLGGLASQPDLPQLLKAARLTPEQISHPDRLSPAVFPAHALDGYQPLTYDKSLAIAPGVVLAKAPGHTPGSQLVFVQRADGTEYLFLGDVAWLAYNVESAKGRPFLGIPLMKESPRQVARQLQVLRTLSVDAPEVHQIPGHDPSVIDRLVSQHLLEEGFTVR
jgi:glyoxylase-like metal-dependent hydrolase (beta-lactamase superfamily II)